jgi:hypothetical protein
VTWWICCVVGALGLGVVAVSESPGRPLLMVAGAPAAMAAVFARTAETRGRVRWSVVAVKGAAAGLAVCALVGVGHQPVAGLALLALMGAVSPWAVRWVARRSARR